MLEIGALALAPRRLRLTEAVAARLDDLGDEITELGADPLERRATSLVFGGVV
jgi:hypothetical protein